MQNKGYANKIKKKKKKGDKNRPVEKSFILNGTIFILLLPVILHHMTKLKSKKCNKTPLLHFKYWKNNKIINVINSFYIFHENCVKIFLWFINNNPKGIR